MGLLQLPCCTPLEVSLAVYVSSPPPFQPPGVELKCKNWQGSCRASVRDLYYTNKLFTHVLGPTYNSFSTKTPPIPWKCPQTFFSLLEWDFDTKFSFRKWKGEVEFCFCSGLMSLLFLTSTCTWSSMHVQNYFQTTTRMKVKGTVTEKLPVSFVVCLLLWHKGLIWIISSYSLHSSWFSKTSLIVWGSGSNLRMQYKEVGNDKVINFWLTSPEGKVT